MQRVIGVLLLISAASAMDWVPQPADVYTVIIPAVNSTNITNSYYLVPSNDAENGKRWVIDLTLCKFFSPNKMLKLHNTIYLIKPLPSRRLHV